MDACLGHSRQADTGVVLLTIFYKINSFIKMKIFCNEILHSYLNHQYHFPSIESDHKINVMKTNIIDF